MKLIAAGSRGINDRDLVWGVLDKLAEEFFISEIVEGECRNSPDVLARDWAEDRGYSLKKFPANWNKYGKAAGHKRNIQMAKYGDILVAFWDGKSLGTRGMIREMQVHNKPWILIPVGWGYSNGNSVCRYSRQVKESQSPFERLGLHCAGQRS
jgi:YspA, cpYpsA-related SLOG family